MAKKSSNKFGPQQMPAAATATGGVPRPSLEKQIPAFTEDVIRLLARQKIDQVIWACSKPESSLKALTFAAAMGTLNT